MLTALLLLISVELFFLARILIRQNQETINLLKQMKTNQASSVEKPVRSPNRLAKVNPDVVQFDENNPLAIPADIKFELEGGDMLTPLDTGKN